MSNNERAFGVMCVKFKPHLLMCVIQLLLSFLYFLVEASLNKGMNPHVFVTYRHVVGGIVVLPFAYVRERKLWPKLTMTMFIELFFLSLFGTSLTLNMFFASLKYTTPSFDASMTNTISSLTFIIAVALRGNFVHNNWIKGSLLAGASCISWSLWFILQAIIAKKYQAQLSLTAWINCMGAAQSAVFAVLVQHKPRAWFITSTVELCCILYAGAICGGLIIFIQFWTAEQKGPVFVSMFNPLGTILVAILAYFLFGEQLHTGSLLGVVIVIIGLYLLLWGKDSDQDYNSQQSLATHVEQRECRTQVKIAMEKEVPQRNVSQDTN
ncbi:hypothetical protein PHAVU_007G194500 [Phaseolus vulgaris]